MKVLVTGSTTWQNGDTIRDALDACAATVVIHGDCTGADALAGAEARKLGIEVHMMEKKKQDYEKYGRNAWMALNERMLECGVQLVLAFHPDIQSSSGTKHMAELADAAGVPVNVFST